MKNNEINEGLRLHILVRKDKRSAKRIATALGITTNWLSKLQKMDKLPDDTRARFCEFYGVPETYFTNPNPNPVFDVVPNRVENELPNYDEETINEIAIALLDQIHKIRNLKK